MENLKLNQSAINEVEYFNCATEVQTILQYYRQLLDAVFTDK